jgi:hypothetical protein
MPLAASTLDHGRFRVHPSANGFDSRLDPASRLVGRQYRNAGDGGGVSTRDGGPHLHVCIV